MFYHSRWSNDIGRRCVIRYCCIPYRSTIPNKNFLLASFILGRVAFLILPPSLLFFAPLDSSLCAYTQQQQQQQQHQQSTLIDLLQVAVPAAAFLINRKDDRERERERERERKKEAKLIISLPLLLISSCHLGNMPTRPLRILWIGSNTREKEREEYKDVLPLIFQQPHSALILSSLPPFPRGTNFLYSTRSTLRRAYATQRHAMQCNPDTIRSCTVVGYIVHIATSIHKRQRGVYTALVSSVRPSVLFVPCSFHGENKLIGCSVPLIKPPTRIARIGAL